MAIRIATMVTMMMKMRVTTKIVWINVDSSAPRTSHQVILPRQEGLLVGGGDGDYVYGDGDAHQVMVTVRTLEMMAARPPPPSSSSSSPTSSFIIHSPQHPGEELEGGQGPERLPQQHHPAQRRHTRVQALGPTRRSIAATRGAAVTSAQSAAGTHRS
jgi:hypothetical protein